MSSNRTDLLGVPRRPRVWIRILKSNFTSTQNPLSDLVIRGLETGRTYKVTLKTYSRVGNGGGIYVHVRFADAGMNDVMPLTLGQVITQEIAFYTGYNGMAQERSECNSTIVKAVSSILKTIFSVSSLADGGGLYAGTNGGYQTALIVEEWDQDTIIDTN